MTAEIIQFPKTKEHHDAMRQVSRSQMPGIQLWTHKCSKAGSKVYVQINDRCPFCGTNEIRDRLEKALDASNRWMHACPVRGLSMITLPKDTVCTCGRGEHGD